MTSRKLAVLTLCVVLLLLAILFAGGRAEEPEEVVEVACYPRELDNRYCDRTRGLVADPHLNKDDWVDLNMLISSYSQTFDPAV